MCTANELGKAVSLFDSLSEDDKTFIIELLRVLSSSQSSSDDSQKIES